MRGNYETARRWNETFKKDVQSVQSDLIEFVPTHMVQHSLERSGSLVMELGRTPTGLAHIQYADGARSKVNPAALQPLPEEKR